MKINVKNLFLWTFIGSIHCLTAHADFSYSTLDIKNTVTVITKADSEDECRYQLNKMNAKLEKTERVILDKGSCRLLLGGNGQFGGETIYLKY